MLTNQVALPGHCAVIESAVSTNSRTILAGNARDDARVGCGA